MHLWRMWLFEKLYYIERSINGTSLQHKCNFNKKAVLPFPVDKDGELDLCSPFQCSVNNTTTRVHVVSCSVNNITIIL